MPKKKPAKSKGKLFVSQYLATIVGSAALTEDGLTKNLWKYISKHRLQNKSNPQMISPDDNLAQLLGSRRAVDMFEMTELVSRHISNVPFDKADGANLENGERNDLPKKKNALRSVAVSHSPCSTIKALSIKQPWVHAILHEGKDIENRSWTRNFRGWIAIHSSAQPSRGAVFPLGMIAPDFKTLDYSAICGVARIIDIVAESPSKWFWQPDDGSINYGWVLSDVTALKTPIQCKGALGLWDVGPQAFREIQRQLPELNLQNVANF